LLPKFQISALNGIIEVTCLRNRTAIGAILKNRIRITEKNETARKLYGLQVTLIAFCFVRIC